VKNYGEPVTVKAIEAYRKYEQAMKLFYEFWLIYYRKKDNK